MIFWVPSSKPLFLLLLSLFYLPEVISVKKGIKTVPLLMPKVQPEQKETYLCKAWKTPEDDFENIVEFLPHVDAKTVHHILLFGCYNPGKSQEDTPDYVWDCGRKVNSTKYEYATVCETIFEQEIMFSWAEGTDPIKLPKDVAFRIGKDTGIDYIVMQVHYWNVDPFLKGKTDSSGVMLKILPGSDKRITKSAGMFLLATAGVIPAHKEVHMEAACRIVEPVTIHPIAFQPHTHKLGKVVSGYKIDKYEKWYLIGKESPLHPEKFYPVKDKNLILEKGDIVASRCTLENFEDHVVNVGEAKTDEMCDFYMLYYADGYKSMNAKFCYTMGPPLYYWHIDNNIKHVPHYIDIDASSL